MNNYLLLLLIRFAGRSTTDAIVHHRYNQEGRQVQRRDDVTTMLYGQDKFNQFMRQERESTAAAAGAGMAEATIHYLETSARIRKDELLGLLRKGDTSAAAALATRSIAPPPMLGPPPPPPPHHHRRPEDDITTLQTESIEHILTYQEAQAKRERELKHLRHLETMQAAVTFENQSILEEELMLQQRQLQLRSRTEQLANLMQHQARSMQQLHQNSMPGVGGFMGRIDSSTRQQQQSSGEGGFNLEVSSTSTSPQKQLCLPPRRRSSPKEDSNCSRKVSLDFATDSNIHKHSNDHAGRSTLGGATAVAIRPPSNNLRPTSNTVRYWNNGVEVNIHGTPLGSSPPRSRHAATTTTTTTATANGVTTAAAAVGMQPTSPSVHVDDSNIISKFAKLVISCVPESTSAISDLLSEFLSTGITSDDLLCVHSKFPGFVNNTLIELKSLEETSKDKEELYERVTSCIAAIEPYKEITTPSSSVYSQLRALTTEGTRLASNVLSQTKKKRRKKRIRTEGVENHSSDSNDDGRSKKKQKPSTSTPHVNILEMYQNKNKNTSQEDKQKESSEVCNVSDDMKSVETKTVAVPASSSVVTSAMSSSEEGGHRGVSDPPLKEEGEDTSIVPTVQPLPEAMKTKKTSVEPGPHGVLLQQLFGKRD